MLCELPKADKLPPWAGSRRIFFQIFFLNIALIAWTPLANGQTSNFATTAGAISGTVLLESDNRPASQVIVSLRSNTAGVFRSVLTDYDGHFEVTGLAPGAYEIIVEESGYEPVRTSTRLDGLLSKLVLHLKPSRPTQTHSSRYTVSVRELKIPGKAADEFRKGMEYLRKGDPAASLSHFTKATQVFPDYYEAYHYKGIAEMDLDHMDEALQALQVALDLSDGRYAKTHFALGYLLCQEGKPREAEAVIRRGMEIDENSADGYVVLGVSFLQQNRLDEAEKSVREALLRQPGYVGAYFVLSDVYALRGDQQARLQVLDACSKLNLNGPAKERIRQAREATLKLLAKNVPKD